MVDFNVYQPYKPLEYQQQQAPLSYQQWLMLTGQQPQQSQQGSPLLDIATKVGKDKILESLGSTGGPSFMGGTPELNATLSDLPTSFGTGETASTGGVSSLATIAPYAGAVAGTYLLGQGLYDTFKNKKTKGLKGWGGRITAGIATGGLSELARAFNGDKDRWKTEGDRLKKLQKSGYNIPVSTPMNLKKGRSFDSMQRKDLAVDYIGQDPKGVGWVNNKFNMSRDVKDLRGEDLQGYAAILEKAGKEASLADRIALGNKALAAGAVKEHHGTIDVDWSKVNQESQQNNKVSGPLVLKGNKIPKTLIPVARRK